MTSTSKERLVTHVVPALLVLVLLGVAGMQYRWSAEVSDAASTRMHAALQESLMSFRSELERDLSTMAQEMQSQGDTPVDARPLMSRLKLWEDTSDQAGIVANVYLWHAQTGAEPDFLHLSDGNFIKEDFPSRWPELPKFLAQLQLPDDAGVSRKPGVAYEKTRPQEPRFGKVDESLLLLIFPARQAAEGADWLIVELDRSALTTRIFPRLIKRYFGSPQTSEYDVTVDLERKNDSYPGSSSRTASSDATDADALLNLFGFPVLEAQNAEKGPRLIGGVTRSANVSGGTANPEASQALNVIRFDPVSTSGARWEIFARHRKGSVEAAVNDLRWRNLALSFGVLSVLGGAVLLLVINSQRARRLAALQMDFVTGVSHELRTPVAAILSAAENIADGIVDEKSQMIRYGKMIKGQARQLNHLVEQVLRFAATRGNTAHYDLQPVDVRKVIGEVLGSTASLIEAAGVRAEIKVPEDLPRVVADAGALFQCLQNLMTNAVKYGGDNKWIGVQAEETGSEVTIIVEDRGIGIDESEIGQIFEPFYRSPSVTSTHTHGTGLGLALAKSFAEAMKGRLTVESEPGNGSRFILSLPVAAGPLNTGDDQPAPLIHVQT